MKRFFLSFISLLCCACIMLAGTVTSLAVSETENLIDGIIALRINQSGCKSLNDLVERELSNHAGEGSAEWYAIGLSAYFKDIDLSAYGQALSDALYSGKVPSAVSKQRCALALLASGRKTDSFLSSVSEQSIGKAGIMSWIFGLELLNNGIASSISREEITDKILSLKNSDGGWSVTGNSSDVDVTAMALTALAPQKGGSAAKAINGGLAFLSSRQLDSGGFKSLGNENAESSAQVLCALTALSIDPKTDSRFIKNGNTVISGLLKFRLSNGGFCHTLGGSVNNTATVQAFYSLVALWRFENRLSSLFDLSARGTRSASSFNISSAEPPSNGKNDNGGEHYQTQQGENTAGGGNGTVYSADGYNGTESQEHGSSSDSPESDPSLPQDGVDAGEGASDREQSASGQGFHGTVSAGAKGFWHSYKPYALGVIILLAAAFAVLLKIKKRLNKKNTIFLAAVSILFGICVMLTSFSSVEHYYSPVTREDSVGKASISIRCDTVLDKLSSTEEGSEHGTEALQSNLSHIPSDGAILDTVELDIGENQTVYELLIDAAKTYGIQVENSGVNGQNSSMAYIKGINYLYEFDFGELSGWMYKVNGQTPSVGCGEYHLSPNDRVEWVYTCDLGQDIA